MAQAHIKHLRKLWDEQEKYHEPWTSGVVDLSEVQLLLLLKLTDNSWCQFQVGSMIAKDIQLLVTKSDQVILGRGPGDETNRQALEFDQESFFWRFNPDSGEFVSRLAQQLCPWDSFESGIHVEPVKVNVYGQGVFLRTHEDTPRAENIFGSLIFTLPTKHEGGNLNLRHRTRELSFDAAAFLHSAPPTSVAYVAFYNDVDCKAREVTSGHQVTITFNLYFDKFRAPSILPEKRLNIPMNPFMSAIREAVNNPGFVKENKYLGFGLEYNYPVKILGHPGANDDFRKKREEYLKGPDALLYRSLKEMGLCPSLKFLYESSGMDDGSGYFWILGDDMVEGQLESDLAWCDTDSLTHLMERYSCTHIVWKEGHSVNTLRAAHQRSFWGESYLDNIDMYKVDRYKSRTMNISWVTMPTNNLSGETEYTEVDREPIREIYYFNVCIVVDLCGRADLLRH